MPEEPVEPVEQDLEDSQELLEVLVPQEHLPQPQLRKLLSLNSNRPAETDEQLKEKYAKELQQMKDMGFTDESTNLDMLKQ